jgi:release factor glutamine methyltransferase
VNLGHALKHITGIFKKNNIQDPANEAGVLLCHMLQIDKSRLFAQPETELTVIQIEDMEKIVQRRLSGEPAAYIIRNKEFYGIDLYVDSRVLIPRPETEILIEEAVKFAREYVAGRQNSRHPLLIADVGTGSGAIAIALAVNLPRSIIYATDISAKALEVAAINVERLGLQDRITLLRGNLLEPLNQKMDMIVANLPYIAETEIGFLQAEVAGHEPCIALKGGISGAEVIHSLISQTGDKIAAGGTVLIEIGAGQEQEITKIVHDCMPGSEIQIIKDLSGISRVVKIRGFR